MGMGMRLAWLLIPGLMFGEATMLSQAEEISQVYSQEIAKAPPPAPFPLAEPCLELSSVWFSVDLAQVAAPNGALGLFGDEAIWSALNEIGIDGVRFDRLRQPGSLTIDPKWGGEWAKVELEATKRSMASIGDVVGNATVAGIDFQEALQNIGQYPNLYHLIEIDPKDWKLLPSVPKSDYETNVPWLTIQQLHKLGYVPEQFSPWMKESAWNATMKIRCVDGKVRRWIYLKEGRNHPVLNWFSPTFAAYRLAAGSALQGVFRQGQQILRLDGAIPASTQQMLSLWIRKIGAFSAVTTDGTIASIQRASADLAEDTATRPALLHALIAEDAEALRMIYRLFLEEGIEANRLVRVLQPFDSYACTWVELMNQPKKKFRYYEEQITGEILRQRLLQDDMYRLGAKDTFPHTTWVDFCSRALGFKDFDKHKEEISNAHLLLAFTYAMQPGAFSISAADLLGALPDQTAQLDLLGSNPTTLYSSLPMQMGNPRSFVSRLKTILAARTESNIAAGELMAVLPTPNRGTLLLAHRLPSSRFIQILAVNFSRKQVQESMELAEIRNTSAIDLMSNLAEEKVFASGKFSFILPPLSGRAFYFQPKYYD